jgi:hypothetical protein
MKTYRKSLLFFDKKNMNGRMYDAGSIPADVLSDFKKRIEDKRAFGELGHPEDSFVSLTNVSHRFLSVDDVELPDGTKLLEGSVTPVGELGKLLETVPEDSWVLRPRFIGNVDDNGRVTVQEIITFDVVQTQDDAFKMEEETYRKFKEALDRKSIDTVRNNE